MGRNLIVLGYVSCNVVKHIIKLYEFIRAQVEKHVLPSFAIVQLDFVQIFVWLEIIQTLHKVKMKLMKSLPSWLVQRPQKNL